MSGKGSELGCATPHIATVLLAIFVVLKLCDLIACPWVWVLSPVWIPLAAIAIVMFVATVFLKLLG